MNKIKIGDKAPNFKLNNQDGKSVQLSDFKNQKLVLFFYPKDMTPGCTNEACNLRDNYEYFTNNNIALLGISADSEERHIRFIGKHELPYDLLSDEDKVMLKDYGVWAMKKFMGREYMGIVRTSFIIDEKGIVEHIISKVKTKAHTEQIQELLSE